MVVFCLWMWDGWFEIGRFIVGRKGGGFGQDFAWIVNVFGKPKWFWRGVFRKSELVLGCA